MSVVGPRPTLRAQVDAVHAAPAPPARGQAGAHGLGAGQRPRGDPVGGADRARRLVRRAPLAGARPADPRPHRAAAGHRPRALRIARRRASGRVRAVPKAEVDAARLPPRRRRGRAPLVQRRARDRRPGRQPRLVHPRRRRRLDRAGDRHLDRPQVGDRDRRRRRRGRLRRPLRPRPRARAGARGARRRSLGLGPRRRPRGRAPGLQSRLLRATAPTGSTPRSRPPTRRRRRSSPSSASGARG